MSLYGRTISSLVFSPARDALAGLLRVHSKDDQAAALMQGELTRLNLAYCSIGDDGAEIVADFLKHDETVGKVNLDDCCFGPRGANVIAEALRDNATVEYLVLDCNEIGNQGGAALINALRYNVCLIFITLYGTSITSESLATITVGRLTNGPPQSNGHSDAVRLSGVF